MAELSELDKETLRSIVESIHPDLSYINMDRIYSDIEDLLSRSDEIITFAKFDPNDVERNTFFEENQGEIDDQEYEYCYILMCKTTIDSEWAMTDMLEKVYEWLQRRPIQ